MASPRSRKTPRPVRLTVTDLVCERAGRRVIDGLGFAVEAGGALVVTGPNGAGKSTLLRALAGLLAAEGGLLLERDGGEPLAGRAIGAACHYLGHADAVKPALTVMENLAFWRAFLGPAERGAEEALAALGLHDLADLPAGYLSAGQRRRLAAARLLIAQRPVWLLDEPTAALDAASAARFVALMNAHLAAGGLIVAATHQPLALAHAAHRALAAPGTA